MSSLLNTPEVSVIGLGFVGGAMFRSFKEKGATVLFIGCSERSKFISADEQTI